MQLSVSSAAPSEVRRQSLASSRLLSMFRKTLGALPLPCVLVQLHGHICYFLLPSITYEPA